jgi:hypothetical protein
VNACAWKNPGESVSEKTKINSMQRVNEFKKK